MWLRVSGTQRGFTRLVDDFVPQDDAVAVSGCCVQRSSTVRRVSLTRSKVNNNKTL